MSVDDGGPGGGWIHDQDEIVQLGTPRGQKARRNLIIDITKEMRENIKGKSVSGIEDGKILRLLNEIDATLYKDKPDESSD